MNISIKKSVLPKGLSYVLKTSVLEEALKPLPINLELNFYATKDSASGNTIFECFYWTPNPNRNYYVFYARIGTVKVGQSNLVKSLMGDVLTKFVEWVELKHRLPHNSTFLKHNTSFQVKFDGMAIAVETL